MKLNPIRLFVVLSTIKVEDKEHEVALSGPSWSGTSVVSIEQQRDMRTFLMDSIKSVTSSINDLKTEASVGGYLFTDVTHSTQRSARTLIEMLSVSELHVLDSIGNVQLSIDETDAFKKACDDKIAELSLMLKKQYLIQIDNDGLQYVKNAGTQYSKYFSSMDPKVHDEAVYNSLKAIKSALTKDIRMYGRESTRTLASYEKERYANFPKFLSTLKIMKYENAEILPLDTDEQKEMNEILLKLDGRLFASTMGAEGA